MLFLTLSVALAVLLGPNPSMLLERRQPAGNHQANLLSAIAAELRAGASVRSALAAATRGNTELSAAGRLARGGAPLAVVANALQADSRLSAAIAVAARSGGKSAFVFSRLAERAAMDAEVERQRRVLTAQARMSAAVVASLPLLWLVFGGIGRIDSMIRGGAGVIAGLGLAMEMAGMALVWRLATR